MGGTEPTAARVEVLAPDGLPEVRSGDDLAQLLAAPLVALGLADGDVAVVTSKVVAKAEGRVVAGPREAWVEAESVRVVARRGPTRIVRTRHGLTMAAAGVDASNVEEGSVVLLPVDPDASARGLRAALHDRTGRNVAVVVTDTAGRAWREGQTDLAVGAAGLRVVESFLGRVDPHGNPLVVTAPAVADEIASASELAQGKLGARPCAVLRGRSDLVLAADDDGPGAVALVRPESADLFGFGARQAVVRALARDDADAAAFGPPADAEELAEAVLEALDLAVEVGPGTVTCRGAGSRAAELAVLAFAHGWRPEPGHGRDVRLRPAGP